MNFLAFLWGPGSWTRVCSFWVQVRTSKPCSDLLANTVSLQSAWQSSAPADVKQTKRSREHSNKHFQVVEFLICFWHYQSSTYLRQIKRWRVLFSNKLFLLNFWLAINMLQSAKKPRGYHSLQSMLAIKFAPWIVTAAQNRMEFVTAAEQNGICAIALCFLLALREPSN